MMLFLFVQLFLRLDCQVAALFCLKSVTIIIYVLKKVIPARALHKIILLPVVALAQSFKGCIPKQSASLLALSQAALQTGSRRFVFAVSTTESWSDHVGLCFL